MFVTEDDLQIDFINDDEACLYQCGGYYECSANIAIAVSLFCNIIEMHKNKSCIQPG